MGVSVSATAEIKEYRFGIDAAKPPYSYQTEKGLEGLAVEMAKKAFEVSGIRAKLVPMTWAEAQKQFRSGELDGLINAGRHHPEVSGFASTGSFLRSDQHFFSRPSAKFAFESEDSLRGPRVAVLRGHFTEAKLNELGGVTIIAYDAIQDALQAVFQLQADAVLGDVNTVEYLIRELHLPNLVWHPEPFSEDSTRIVVSSELHGMADRLNLALGTMRKTGQYQRVYARWDKQSIDFLGQQDRNNQLIVIMAAGLILLVAILLREHSNRMRVLQSKRDKENFIARVTHEFRTPLNTIHGTLKLMAPKDPEDQEALSRMSGASQQLVSMTNNILLWEKQVLNTLKPVKQIYTLELFLGQLEKQFAEVMRVNGCQWEVVLQDNLPQYQKTDWQLLRKVLENLLDNAARYAAGSAVTLNVRHGGGRLMFVLTDTGPGMPKEVIDQLSQVVFQPFRDAQKSDSQTVGLGLAVSKSVAHALGGSLGVRNEVSGGTSIIFSVPLNRASAEEADAFERAQKILRASDKDSLVGYQVMVVDDHTLNLKINGRLFKSRGAEVFTAASAYEAEHIVRTQLEEGNFFDVIFMDLQMPDVTGFECIERLRAQHPTVGFKFVALTACDHDTLYEELAAVGVTDVLHKPFDVEDAVRMIHQSGARSLNLTKRILADIRNESDLSNKRKASQK